jgi:hypothetical protein
MFVTNHAVGSYPTISPLPLRAVSFLMHFPSPHGAQALPGGLSYAAPTFLEQLALVAFVCSTQSKIN